MNLLQSSKRRLIGWGALVVVLVLGYPTALFVGQRIYGGPHTVSAGEAYGFRIGMTKREVLDKYRTLNEPVNLRAVEDNGTGGSAVVLEPSELLLTAEFESSDHWLAYRHKFPLYYHEFYFSGGKLNKIVTYIRFYETP